MDNEDGPLGHPVVSIVLCFITIAFCVLSFHGMMEKNAVLAGVNAFLAGATGVAFAISVWYSIGGRFGLPRNPKQEEKIEAILITLTKHPPLVVKLTATSPFGNLWTTEYLSAGYRSWRHTKEPPERLGWTQFESMGAMRDHIHSTLTACEVHTREG